MVVTHTALATPLGLDAKSSCAAARAGIVRSTEVEDFPLNNKEFYSVEYAVVNPVPVITNGYQGDARLWVMLEHVLKDLAKQAARSFSELNGRLFVSLPHPYRYLQGAALLAYEPDEDLLEINRLLDEQRPDLRDYLMKTEELVSALWPELSGRIEISISGATAVAESLAKAKLLVDQQSVDYAVIVAADSFVSNRELEWLQSTGRLKSSENSQGVMPAEASAAMIVCAGSQAKDLGLKSDVSLADVQCGQVDQGLISGIPANGRQLAQLLRSSYQSIDAQCADIWLFSDANGEHYRALEYGLTLTLLQQTNPEIESQTTWLPALSFGFSECCYLILAVSMASEAYYRKYNPSKNLFVLATSDDSGRAVLRIALGA